MGHKASDMTEQLTYLDEKCFQSLQNSLRCISRHKIEKEIPFIVGKKQRRQQKKPHNFLKTQSSFKVMFLINYCLLIYKSVTLWKVPGRRQPST